MIAEFLPIAAKFQSPENLAAELERCRADVTLDDFFNKPENQPFLDAWVAVMFGLGYQRLTGRVTEVRICHPAQFPDFQMRVGRRVHDFEATVALKSKLGEEYRGDLRLGSIRIPRPASVPEFDDEPVKAAVRRKVAKHYAGTVNLVVYASYDGGNANYERVSRVVRDEGGQNFSSLWMLTGTHMSCLRKSPYLASAEGWLELPVEPPPLVDDQAAAETGGASSA